MEKLKINLSDPWTQVEEPAWPFVHIDSFNIAYCMNKVWKREKDLCQNHLPKITNGWQRLLERMKRNERGIDYQVDVISRVYKVIEQAN